jgi:DNA repair exonuclease SbcCD nuclease subunit
MAQRLEKHMSEIYGLIADCHLHQWSAFADVTNRGLNTRLKILLKEIERCAREVRNRGGKKLVIAGDLFHTRGALAPSVLNPALDTFHTLTAWGFDIHVLAGNHDLESRETTRLHSAVAVLERLGCRVVSELPVGDSGFVMISWVPQIEKLKQIIVERRDHCEKHFGKEEVRKLDLILHAPIDGVIPGLPDYGLKADWLAGLGFRNVFAGHYHNHVEFPGNVYSIGALAHHTWSDVGTRAGFMIVGEDGKSEFIESDAPKFIEITDGMARAEIESAVKGNYVRARIGLTKLKDAETVRAYLAGCGAKGVTLIALKENTATLRAKKINVGASLEASVADYVKTSIETAAAPPKLATLCQRILAEAREAA